MLPYLAIATTYLHFDLRVAKELAGEQEETSDVLPEETRPRAERGMGRKGLGIIGACWLKRVISARA